MCAYIGCPNQCSFMPGRHSSNNIVIAQGIIHSMRIKKGNKGWMVIKVDLEKVYDCLEWSFLDDTLRHIRIGDKLHKLIMECISTPSFQINGEITEAFKSSRGVNQGIHSFHTYLSYVWSGWGM